MDDVTKQLEAWLIYDKYTDKSYQLDIGMSVKIITAVYQEDLELPYLHTPMIITQGNNQTMVIDLRPPDTKVTMEATDDIMANLTSRGRGGLKIRMARLMAKQSIGELENLNALSIRYYDALITSTLKNALGLDDNDTMTISNVVIGGYISMLNPYADTTYKVELLSSTALYAAELSLDSRKAIVGNFTNIQEHIVKHIKSFDVSSRLKRLDPATLKSFLYNIPSFSFRNMSEGFLSNPVIMLSIVAEEYSKVFYKRGSIASVLQRRKKVLEPDDMIVTLDRMSH